MIRLARQVVRLPLLKRFAKSLRDDGLSVSLRKARNYIGMRRRGEAATSLNHADTSTTLSEDTYLRGTWQQLAQKQGFHTEKRATGDHPRFVAIIGDLNLPQCRKYRVEQLAEFLQSQGIACDYAHYQDLPRTVALMARASHLIEYRLQSSPLTEMLRYEARRLRLPVLFDIDDPLFSISAYETYGNMAALDAGMKAHFVSEAPKYLTMMNGADAICVSTPGLADHARLLTSRDVYVRRNFADSVTLDAGADAVRNLPASDGVFRVAFSSGSQGHEVDFATVLPVLETFMAQSDDRRLLILGHFDLSHLPASLADRTETVPFGTYEDYLAALARADCAIMPLADDIFNRCKSAVRVIDASAVNVPSIVGTVGDLANMVRHGETGIVAKTPQDWADALDRFAQDRGVAHTMGAAARFDLETHWQGDDVDHIIAPELMDWVRS